MAIKKTTAKPAAKKPTPDATPRRNKASAHTPQTGMEPGPDTEAAEKAAKDQFAEADAKGAPDAQAFEDLQVQRSVRGW